MSTKEILHKSNNATSVPYKAALSYYINYEDMKCTARSYEAPLESHMASEIASLIDAMVGTSCVYKALTAGPVEEEEAVFATHSASVGTTSSTPNPRI